MSAISLRLFDVVVVEDEKRHGSPKRPPRSFAGLEVEACSRNQWRCGSEQEQSAEGSLVTEGELRKSGACAMSASILPTGNDDSHADEAGRRDEPHVRLISLVSVTQDWR